VDVVWTGERLVVAGPATGPVMAKVPAGAAAMGVRFRVGAAGAALGLPAAELLDATIALEDLWGCDGADLAERIGSAGTPTEQLRALVAAVGARGAAPDPVVRAAATGVQRAALGIGDRQLRRRFADAVGYGPKTLQRVLRFQRFLALAAREVRADLARLALEAGYADQAHLTRECTRLAGLPPAALLAAGAGPAGDRSVSFKTPARDHATMAA
jgi:AraC-like DNA-binding protein